MASEDLPQLAFEPFTHLTCSRHSEPFRRIYPTGYVFFSMELMKLAFENEGIQREARASEDGWEERLLAILAERPACEWAEPDVLKRLYRTSHNWPFGVCENCRLAKKGSTYTIAMSPSAKVRKDYSHICFDCVVDYMVPQSSNDR